MFRHDLGAYQESVGADDTTFGPVAPTAAQTTMQTELDVAKAQYQRLILWGFVGVIGLATLYYYNYGE